MEPGFSDEDEAWIFNIDNIAEIEYNIINRTVEKGPYFDLKYFGFFQKRLKY